MNRNVAGTFERVNRSWRQLCEFVHRLEPAEMERCFRKTVFGQPVAHPFYHIQIISPRGDDKVSDFEPHTFIFHCHQCIKNWLKFAGVQFQVNFVAERFQVDVGGIGNFAEF